VSRWLAERSLGAGDLTASVAERFGAERRAAGRRRLVSTRGLFPLLGHLRDLEVAPAVVLVAPSTPGEVLIERYSAYLLERRGLAAPSVRNYVGVARAFLADRERARGELALTGLDAAAVSEFVSHESRRWSVGSAKCMVTRLRALLRFPAHGGRDRAGPGGRGAVGRELAPGVVGEGAGRAVGSAAALRL
jgi:integrase/recombinase XerD